MQNRTDRRSRSSRVARAGVVALLAIGASALPALAAERPGVISLEPSPSRGTIQLTAPGDEDGVLRQLELERGKSVFARTDYSVKRVSVGDPGILDVVVISPRELQFVAKAEGSTNVLIWDTQGRPQAAIDVHVGTAFSHLASELHRILDNEDISVESAGNAIVLKGTVPNAVAQEQALEVARSIIGDAEGKKIVNLLEVGGRQQVMLEVVVAEMSRSVKREFGTNLNALITNGGNSIEVFGFLQNLTQPSAEPGILEISDMVNLAGTFLGFGSLDFQVFLDALDEQGLSKVLAEPTLVARSGETASFLVGGETPIPIAQGGAFGSITVEFKQFGVGMSFTPTVLGPDRIHLEVSPEVSQADFSFGTEVEGTVVPGFNTRRASTTVELGDGESFAIAGLLNENVTSINGEYPWLGKVPILGALFRSTKFQKNETELVIIVTPRLVKPLGPGPHPLPTDHYVEPAAWEFYLLGALEGRAQDVPPASGGVIGDVGHRISTTPEGGSQ